MCVCSRAGRTLETISSAALGIDKHAVESAMDNVVRNLRSVTFGAVTRADNERLWNENVQVSEPGKIVFIPNHGTHGASEKPYR